MNTIGMRLPAVTVQRAVMVDMYMVQQDIQDMSALHVIIQIQQDKLMLQLQTM